MAYLIQLVQWGLERWNTETRLVDQAMGERIGGVALDFLITGAIASVRTDVLTEDVGAFVLLGGVGLAWCFFGFCLSWKLTADHQFERGICEFGQNVGVLASGMILLRIVDPQSHSPVPAAFAYKQLLQAPIMGGGLWTALSVPLTASLGNFVVGSIAAGALGCWVLLWYFSMRPRLRESRSSNAYQLQDELVVESS